MQNEMNGKCTNIQKGKKKSMKNKTTAMASTIPTGNFPNAPINYILSAINSPAIPKLVFTFKQLTITWTCYIWKLENTEEKKLHLTWKNLQNWILNIELW